MRKKNDNSFRIGRLKMKIVLMICMIPLTLVMMFMAMLLNHYEGAGIAIVCLLAVFFLIREDSSELAELESDHHMAEWAKNIIAEEEAMKYGQF